MQVPDLSQADYRFVLSLTSLKTEEFLELLSHFHPLWQRHHRHHDLQGRPRRIAKYSEHASMSLRGSARKLFFVLVCLKQNPLQCYHALAFQMSQGKVSQWLKALLPLLEQALHRMQQQPARTPGHLYLSLCLLSEQVLLLDATGRTGCLT